MRISGSGTGSTQPVSITEELLERKSSGSGLEIRAFGIGDPQRRSHGTLYPQTLALTSSSGVRSVGIVRSWTQATECSLVFIHSNISQISSTLTSFIKAIFISYHRSTYFNFCHIFEGLFRCSKSITVLKYVHERACNLLRGNNYNSGNGYIQEVLTGE
jgi:hypothetical protein